jgi:FKBP-type peptidyl-prolyl cis-trans isomerase
MISALALSAILLTQTKPAGPHVEIKDDVVGTGPVIKSGDIVAIDYTGTLANGTEFDTSVGKEPIMFMVGIGQVIKGWDSGVIGMHEGGKRELTIPPALGYGDKALQSIPANSTLHFTLTVIKIEPKIQVEILAQGKGNEAHFGDVVHVHFGGGIKNGKTLFDTHVDANKEPIPMVVGEGNLPIGFMASLIGMKEGEKRKVTIPSELAYGKLGVPRTDKGDVKAGSVVPPNSTMEFTFELVKLEHPK